MNEQEDAIIDSLVEDEDYSPDYDYDIEYDDDDVDCDVIDLGEEEDWELDIIDEI